MILSLTVYSEITIWALHTLYISFHKSFISLLNQKISIWNWNKWLCHVKIPLFHVSHHHDQNSYKTLQIYTPLLVSCVHLVFLAERHKIESKFLHQYFFLIFLTRKITEATRFKASFTVFSKIVKIYSFSNVFPMGEQKCKIGIDGKR